MKSNVLPKKNYVFLFFGLILLLLLIELSMRLKFSVIGMLSGLNLSPFLKNNLSSYISFSFVVLPLLLVELLLPNDKANQDVYKRQDV